MSCPYHRFYDTIHSAFQDVSNHWHMAATDEEETIAARKIVDFMNIVSDAGLEVEQQEAAADCQAVPGLH